MTSTPAAAFARERHQKVMAAGTAARPGEPEAENAAAEVCTKLLLDVPRHGVFTEAPLGKLGFEVAGDDPVERRSLGAPSGVLLSLAVRRAGLCPHGRTCRGFDRVEARVVPGGGTRSRNGNGTTSPGWFSSLVTRSTYLT